MFININQTIHYTKNAQKLDISHTFKFHFMKLEFTFSFHVIFINLKNYVIIILVISCLSTIPKVSDILFVRTKYVVNADK